MPLLLVLFIVVPLVELFVIIEVGRQIGALPTIGLVLLTGIAGAALASSQGRAVWRRFNAALSEGRVPGHELIDGAMVIFGGALLLTPGFITDAVGIVLLLPPTRALVRRPLVRIVRLRAAARVPMFGWAAGARGGGGRAAGRRPGESPSRAYDLDGTAQEVPETPAELGDPGRDD